MLSRKQPNMRLQVMCQLAAKNHAAIVIPSLKPPLEVLYN
jgi:hypothetical protein